MSLGDGIGMSSWSTVTDVLSSTAGDTATESAWYDIMGKLRTAGANLTQSGELLVEMGGDWDYLSEDAQNNFLNLYSQWADKVDQFNTVAGLLNSFFAQTNALKITQIDPIATAGLSGLGAAPMLAIAGVTIAGIATLLYAISTIRTAIATAYNIYLGKPAPDEVTTDPGGGLFGALGNVGKYAAFAAVAVLGLYAMKKS